MCIKKNNPFNDSTINAAQQFYSQANMVSMNDTMSGKKTLKSIKENSIDIGNSTVTYTTTFAKRLTLEIFILSM